MLTKYMDSILLSCVERLNAQIHLQSSNDSICTKLPLIPGSVPVALSEMLNNVQFPLKCLQHPICLNVLKRYHLPLKLNFTQPAWSTWKGAIYP